MGGAGLHFAQLPIASNALALVGAVTGPLPFGRCLGLEASNEFTQFVGGDVAAFAVRVRLPAPGLYPATALSSGAIASTASWVAKGILFLISVSFAAGNFEAPADSGGHRHAIWVVVGLVSPPASRPRWSPDPRLRRVASARIRPRLMQIWTDVKAIASEPRKITYVVAGSTLSQLFVALALGAALHAVGQRASIATLLVVITGAAIVGGAVPVPGGAGVIEAGLIAGLPAPASRESGRRRGVHPAPLHRLPPRYGDGSPSTGCGAMSTCDRAGAVPDAQDGFGYERR